MSGKLILASNRLPVTVTEDRGTLAVHRSIGGVATALDAVFQNYNALWVGWAGLDRALRPEESATLELPERLIPIQAEAALVRGYYDHFANQVLWPSLHQFWPTRAPSTANWEAMQEIGRRFAAAITQIARPEDSIWVHDYHLMMVPKALRDAGLSNRIGFFLHTPFATPQHWWAVAHHRELLESLYEVDVMGVQTPREVEQLWECIRALGERQQPGLIRAFPIGINYKAHTTYHRREQVQYLVAGVHRQYTGKKIIFSASRLDYTKGILTQLEAVERFFEGSADRKRYVYKLVVAPSRERVKAYGELQRMVYEKATAINSRFGTADWQPVEYSYENHSLDQMAAWYIAADVLLLMPVIDGMNLIAKEYVAVRQEPGLLVLSSGAGAAAQLQGALIVPPEEPAAAAEALAQAFAMSVSERQDRWGRMQRNVRDEDVLWWAERFVAALRIE